jgi:hypothetical protein
MNTKRIYSVVILFCAIEFSRPVRDGMLVENEETNDTRPVGCNVGRKILHSLISPTFRP